MSMQGTAPGEPRMFDLNRPQGYAKDDYLWQWKVANDTIFGLIARNNGNQNTRDIVMTVMFSISLIAHDDLRRKQELLFHTALDYINDMPDWSANRKAEETIRVAAITMGNLTAYVDQFRGLAHTLKVGELINLNKPYARLTHAFPIPEDQKEVIEL